MTPIRVAESLLPAAHRLYDAAAIAGVLLLALQATPTGGGAGHSLTNEWAIVAACAVLIFHTAAELTGLYRSWRGARLRRELGCIVLTWVYTLPVLFGIGLLSGYNGRFTYESKLIWIVGAPLVMLAARALFGAVQAALRARGYNLKHVAVCGVNELGIQLARNLKRSPELGLSLTGFYDDRPGDRLAELPEDLQGFAGKLTDLVAAARSGAVEIVYITFPMRAEDRIRGVLAALADTTASVYIVPDFFVFQLLHARWTSIDGLPAVSVHENPLSGIDGLTKRAFDLVVGGLGLAALTLPMLVIAAAVKFTSPGPVFFRQKRYGLDGREIRVWKFRSMRVQENGAEVRQATKGDDRITPVGRVLRKTSLDELPQLLNVIEGTMSLVGPRPHATAHNEQYRSLIDGYMLRHKVKPGITGLAQVRGYRGETDTLDKMQGRVYFDHQYIRNWSIWMDLRILFETISVVFKQENAY
ncbi:UDP-glucose:undecaprenyl-phosphate glucose-1-phosphate transferase [Pirellulimonas nuda]|uniref:UDP-glucose:undecaprenyl-phosphate glucose-1-phosphate transferase n=1 Tax=Pirellulimonas nuda TaxID=2528009 RepID=A0A518DF33_9BACT|nr:undecaprenyl-phosphate glucose phosphotransferase [Pirellulimonas nuda]QDU90091.1 UDP-glucose:undecaprenyl-phosphate glucose-1-phosphate transferase [Pirellulimonas nuda]